MSLSPDRLFPADPTLRRVARTIYGSTAALPLICPHTHCDPAWFADDQPFSDPASLFVIPDHYVLRMLVSQGVSLSALGRDPEETATSTREIWRTFAARYDLFLGTPSRLWIDYALSEVLGIERPITEEGADRLFDDIAERLRDPAFRPRALYQRFGIHALATTDDARSDLAAHDQLMSSSWDGRVIPTFRPDALIDPTHPSFDDAVTELGAITGRDVDDYDAYLDALRDRRASFRARGATATDHGPESPTFVELDRAEALRIYRSLRRGQATETETRRFGGHMLMVMAEMSAEDGLVMQLHPGSVRNYDIPSYARYGADIGADIPRAVGMTDALRPVLNRLGHHRGFRLIVFTLDESVSARELAPLAGYFPALRLGPPWWFYDAPDAMLRWWSSVSETAGFANTVGFNDDTRGFLSIPGRHDVARRINAVFLARLVTEHRIGMDDALGVAQRLVSDLPREAYRL
jgi:glucuronate isomerase